MRCKRRRFQGQRARGEKYSRRRALYSKRRTTARGEKGRERERVRERERESSLRLSRSNSKTNKFYKRRLSLSLITARVQNVASLVSRRSFARPNVVRVEVLSDGSLSRARRDIIQKRERGERDVSPSFCRAGAIRHARKTKKKIFQGGLAFTRGEKIYMYTRSPHRLFSVLIRKVSPALRVPLISLFTCVL